jgi:hypothetical protein
MKWEHTCEMGSTWVQEWECAHEVECTHKGGVCATEGDHKGVTAKCAHRVGEEVGGESSHIMC